MNADTLPILGQPFEGLPLTFVRSIEEYEGPILSELSDDSGTPYLEKAVDCSRDQKIFRSLVVVSSPHAIEEYLAGRMSMLDLLTLPNESKGILVDTKFRTGERTGEVVRSARVDISTLPSGYLPDPTAMYDETLDPKWR